MTQLLTVLNFWTDKREFLKAFAGNENKMKQATRFWNEVDSGAFDGALLGIMLFVTLLLCWFYFFPFNNRPGRHYLPKYWGWFFVGAMVATFVLSFVACQFLLRNATFDMGLIFGSLLTNVVFSALVFFVASFCVWRSGNSNAYPLF